MPKKTVTKRVVKKKPVVKKKSTTKKCENHRQAVYFVFYSILVIIFFTFLLVILAQFTNTWLYFNILSEKSGISIEGLKAIHYGIIVMIAILWAYNSYMHANEKHGGKTVKRHELVDHHALNMLKTVVLPFLLIITFLSFSLLALLKTYGPLTYVLKVDYPNDPTIFEFFGLIESVLLVGLAFIALIYLLRKFLYWMDKK